MEHLTEAQFAFMRDHQQEIERAHDFVRRGKTEEALAIVTTLSNSTEYKRLFDNISWDEAFDRFEDTPGYDSSLREAFIQQFLTDMDAEAEKAPANGVTAPDVKTVSLDTLRERLLNE